MLSSFGSATGFLTILPLRGRLSGMSLGAFPIVGLFVGGFLGLCYLGLHRYFLTVATAGMIVALDAGVTGLLHLDALGDAGDGLIPHLIREKRLIVMADPQVGAFGVATIILVELVRLASLTNSKSILVAMSAAYAMSRGLMAIGVLTARSAKANSMLGIFGVISPKMRHAIRLAVIIQMLAVIIGGSLLVGPRILLGGVVAVVLFSLVMFRAYRAIGGATGDVIGAAGVLGEVGFLLLALGLR